MEKAVATDFGNRAGPAHLGKKALRIAYVTETYPPEVNGVANTAVRFVEGLRARGHAIQLVRPRQDRGDHAHNTTGYREILMPGMPIPRYPDLRMGLPSTGELQRLWNMERPHLVHIVTEGPLGWSALRAALKLKLPVSSDFRTNFHAYSRHYGIGWLQKPIAAYLRGFHNRTGLTLVPTEAMRADLTRRGFRNLRVVARGVDTQLFDPTRRSLTLRAHWGAGPDDPVVLHVGRLAPEKNLEPVITAFEQARTVHSRAKLVFVGDGPARDSLRARCPDAVFAGTRIGVDLAEHYASGDVFLFSSLTETFGNVTVEALASGLAVVAYDYAAAREHIVHGHNGMLARYDDSAEFARHAISLLQNPARRREIGQRAHLCAETLAWTNVVEEFETMLQAVAESPPAPAGLSIAGLFPGAAQS